MRTTPDTDRKQLRRPRRGGLGWHRWLLYPLIAVSAYLLVALAKAVPDAAGVAGVMGMTSYMAGRMVAKTSASDLSVEQLALAEKMRAHASSSEADHAGFMYSILVALCLAACSYQEKDVSHDHDAQELIGTKYKTVDDIRAYGVRPHSSAPADYVVLTAPPGFAGPEVAFEEIIHRGAVITVSRVLKTSRLFENPYTLIVQLDSAALRTALPIKVALYGSNEGPTRLSLNPAFFERLTTAEPATTKTKSR